MANYFGKYAEFQTESKKAAAPLLSADTMIGDVLTVECELENGSHRAWLYNPLGMCIGFLDSEVSRDLSLQAARGLELHAVLSFVAFTDHPDDGHYWGDVALVCYPPSQAEAFRHFLAKVSDQMAQGIRLNVDLGADAITHIAESEGQWLPEQTVPMPAKIKGTAIIKQRRGFNDRLIQQGRAGNKGCYVASWVFLLLLVALIIFGLHSCFFS